jgi:hypothetical protein
MRKLPRGMGRKIDGLIDRERAKEKKRARESERERECVCVRERERAQARVGTGRGAMADTSVELARGALLAALAQAVIIDVCSIAARCVLHQHLHTHTRV